jgi:radical SAM protein with 4Fe4S-binding SPASM domain
MNKKNFCPAPWMHLHVINDGRAFPCCQTPLKDEYSFGNVKENTLLEILNSDRAKQMRLSMLNGEPLPPSCERCTSKEAVGMNSMRTGLFEGYFNDATSIIESTNPDGSLDKLELMYWDFRFSNYCNLSCRTCGPIFSTSWAKDAKIIWKTSNKDKTPALIDLKDASLFWNDIANHIDSVKEIHFAGGEPVIMEEHWRIIDLLLEKGLINTRLKYSTNATTLVYKGRNILDVWKKFPNVHVSLSIDAVNDAFDYIRNRGNWKEVEQNLLDIASSGVEYWIHPTISVLNIYRLIELHDKLLSLKIINPKEKNLKHYFITQFHLNPLFTPEYYSLQSLPKDHKVAIEKMLRKYALKMYLEHKIPMSGWESVIKFMNDKDASANWKTFIDMTNKLDLIRNQKFFQINPEFKEYFNV